MTEIDNEIQIIVDAWKKKRFLEQQISLIEAVKSLDTERPAIEVRPLGQSNRWLVYNSDTKRPALFTHAGLWAWHSNLKTGNFVPIGKTAPPKTYETRIQNKMSNRCEFSYAFDTQADSSFQDLMMKLEAYAIDQPGFNKGNKPRRVWQDGLSDESRQRFIFGSRIFNRQTPFNKNKLNNRTFPEGTHPWIIDALQTQKTQEFFLNTANPKFFDFVGRRLVKINVGDDQIFQRFDIVWVSFKIGFNFGLENWGPDLVPIQFVRVGKAPEHTNSGTDPASWPSDDDTDYELPEGDDVMLIDGPSQMSKRKFEEPSYIDWPSSDDEDTRSMKRLIIDGNSHNVTDDGELVMADAEDVTEDSAEEQVKTPKRRMLRRGRAD